MRASSIFSNQKGAVAIIFALLLPVLIAIVALSVDAPKMQTTHIRNNNAIDAAVLAASEFILRTKLQKAKDIEFQEADPARPNLKKWQTYQPQGMLTQAEEIARGVYETNIQEGGYTTAPTSFTLRYDNNTFKTTLKACAEEGMTGFGRFLDKKAVTNICEEREASFAFESSLRNAEIAFSLDVTGSMVNNNSRRIEGLIDAINYLADNKLNKNGENNVKYSVVPYQTAIMFGNYPDLIKKTNVEPGISDIDSPGVAKTADGSASEPYMYDMQGSRFVELGTYYDVVKGKFGSWQGKNDGYIFNPEVKSKIKYWYEQPNYNIQPLTSDPEILKAMVKGFKDQLYIANVLTEQSYGNNIGGTSGLGGIFGAWLTLAPAWKGKWNAPSMMEQNPDAFDFSAYRNPNSKLVDGFDTKAEFDSLSPQQLDSIELITIPDIANIDNKAKADIKWLEDDTPQPIDREAKFKYLFKRNAKLYNGTPQVEDRSNLPADYNKGIKKYIIHMTDGEDNPEGRDTDPFYVDTDTDIDDDYFELCKNIKDEGIEIFIILFGDEARKQSYHQRCVADDHIYIAQSNEQLEQIYKNIFDLIESQTTNVKLVK